MKQLFFILIIFCAFSVNAQVKAPKGFDVGGTIIDANEVKSLNGITGNIKDTLDSKISTSTLGSSLDEFYNKTQSNTRFINEDGDTITGTILVPTPAAGTNTTQVVNAEFVSRASNIVGKFNRAGVTSILGAPWGWDGIYYSATNAFTLVDNTVIYVLLDPIMETKTITSIQYQTSTGGSFTADNNNKVALCKYNGTTYEKVAESANDGTMYNGSNTPHTINLTSPYVASPGYYAVAFLYNCSGTATTTPTLYTYTAMSGVNLGHYLPSTFKLSAILSGQNDIPTIVNVSSLTWVSVPPFAILK